MKTAEAGSVMCAYQGVNGVPMCSNGFILNRVVRADWGWKGFVVCAHPKLCGILALSGHIPWQRTATRSTR